MVYSCLHPSNFPAGPLSPHKHDAFYFALSLLRHADELRVATRGVMILFGKQDGNNSAMLLCSLHRSLTIAIVVAEYHEYGATERSSGDSNMVLHTLCLRLEWPGGEKRGVVSKR